ncbi:hypothetical protein IRJ41_002498 [Triplophysa rosa]|uniref:Uncharacterized protein n=1 Tax=Triplophysa rosa TaxID=992332 RepID=A0A9W7TD92_TRIRA|nr:hypothetical protein IRJ41_002498 [Triplophysa rosa]
MCHHPEEETYSKGRHMPRTDPHNCGGKRFQKVGLHLSHNPNIPHSSAIARALGYNRVRMNQGLKRRQGRAGTEIAHDSTVSTGK